MTIEGSVVIESEKHQVQYEPTMYLSTLFLRVKNGDKNIPIFTSEIDEVIEMLTRGKRAIEALENTCAEARE